MSCSLKSYIISPQMKILSEPLSLYSHHFTSLSLRLSLAGACCPSGVRLYVMTGNSLRVYWRSAGSSHSYVTEMVGGSNNYTCTASSGESSCDVDNVQCGDVYNVVVAPLTQEGATTNRVLFCPVKQFSGRTSLSGCVVVEMY